MNSTGTMWLLFGAGLGLALIPVLVRAVRAFAVEVEDDEAVLVTSFGRLAATLTRPGWHWMPARLMPWVALRRVSLARDFRTFESIHINDARGTTVTIDLWLEFRVVDPAKATFAVEDWDEALHNLVSHASISILGNRDFQQILCDRSELGERLRLDLVQETERWGIRIEQVFIRDVNLLPEVARHVLGTIAARLERAKADLEEEGRQRVALLEAETSARVAKRVADAKGQYPAAVGRALAKLQSQPRVLAAYNELYELSLLRPHRMIAFSGFGEGEVRAADAAMLAPLSSPSEAGESGSRALG